MISSQQVAAPAVAVAVTPSKRVYFMHAWQDVTPNAKVPVQNCVVDQNVTIDITVTDPITKVATKYTLVPNDRFQFWPNKKREGKRDADFVANFQIPA